MPVMVFYSIMRAQEEGRHLSPEKSQGLVLFFFHEKDQDFKIDGFFNGG